MNPIIYVDHSEVREGKLAELKTIIRELAEFVKANEPRLISYNVYFNEEETQMTVIHIHPDSASLEFHLKIAGQAFQGFLRLLRNLTIDLYGDPDKKVLDELHKKAKLLGSGIVTVHKLLAEFNRFGINLQSFPD